MFIYIMTSSSGIIPQIIGNGAAIAAIIGSGLPEKIGDGNPIVSSAVTAVSFALANDLYDWTTGHREPLLLKNMQYKEFADKSIYYGLVATGAGMLNLDSMVADQLRTISPLDPRLNGMLLMGGMVTGASVLRDYLIQQPSYYAQALARPLHALGY